MINKKNFYKKIINVIKSYMHGHIIPFSKDCMNKSILHLYINAYVCMYIYIYVHMCKYFPDEIFYNLYYILYISIIHTKISRALNTFRVIFTNCIMSDIPII